MVTLRQYRDAIRAGMDKSLLDAAGIPAFLADADSASVGYGAVVGGVRLQVEEADFERAWRALGEQADFAPLPDDFVPPEEPPAAPPPPPAEGGSAFIRGGLIAVAAFGIAAALAIAMGNYVHATLGSLVLLFVIGGLVGSAVRAVLRRSRADATQTSGR